MRDVLLILNDFLFPGTVYSWSRLCGGIIYLLMVSTQRSTMYTNGTIPEGSGRVGVEKNMYKSVIVNGLWNRIAAAVTSKFHCLFLAGAIFNHVHV